MSSDHTHDWDQPKPEYDPASPGVMTTPSQALTGVHIGLANCTVRCSGCDETLRESNSIGVYAYRAADAPEWVLTRCYCQQCAPEVIETPTLGTSEVVVTATLDVVSLSSEQRHQLCLGDVETLAVSPLTEGAVP